MKLFPIILALSALARAQDPQRGQLDSSPSLFAVLAAMQAAGLDPDPDSGASHPLRAQIREYVASKNPPVLADLRAFRERHPNAALSNYISLGLAIDGPPFFKLARGLKEPPPDAVLLEALTPLLARLWAEADLDAAWRRAQPAYEQAIAKSFHEPVTREILRANAFLRNPTSGYPNRRFQIYVELTAPPNQVHARSFGDDYFVVVTPSPEPQIADIRRAYLYYLLDPLSLKYARQLREKSGLLQFAQAAPALDPHYKDDFQLLATACLVRAVDARLTAVPGGARLQLVDQAFKEGFILAPFFYDHLPAYEAQERAMRLYYPDMIAAIDLKREDKRLSGAQWAEAKAARTIRAAPEAKGPVVAGALQTLGEAEDLYNQKRYPGAKEKFAQALRETDSRPLHAKSYFGLARVAALGREFEAAEKLFEKALGLDPDPEIQAWSLVYLGRLLFSSNEAAPALERFKAALAVEGAPESARQAAEKGLREAAAEKSK